VPSAADELVGPVGPVDGNSPQQELVDLGALLAEPLIEEPVASGGDSSLWTDAEDDEDEDEEEGDNAAPTT
jgi:hypothetical protein